MHQIKGDWISNPATQSVMGMLANAGHQVFFVGGCVRNALLDVRVADIDIATDAPPDQVVKLATIAGIKAIPTGIDHGTITVVSAGIAHEITTFRNDISTDGRRATVTFSDNMTDDAHRRDFTINALYADQKGNVIDPLHGIQDLLDRRVRFIGDANARIREDYLRMLRFFRFHACYGDPDGGMDADALAAITANLTGLDMLSRERVGSEMIKLLGAADPAPAVATMHAIGVLGAILPGTDPQYLAPLIHLEQGDPPDPIRRLAVLGGKGLKERLRLSRKDDDRLQLLRNLIGQNLSGRVAGYLHGARLAIDAELLQSAILGRPVRDSYREAAISGADLVFPVKAADLMPRYQGVELGKRLDQLKTRWINSDFELTRSQLLA